MIDQRRVIGRIGDDGDIGVVLGRSADHRRAADVDILDAFRIVSALGPDLFEWIEIDDREIDRGNPVIRHRLPVLGVVADGEKAAMHIRMQRLDAAIHDFRKAGDLGDVGDSEAGIRQRLERAPGRQDGDAERDQFAGQLHHA